MADLKCSCGNKYMVSLNTMSDDPDVVVQPSEKPTAWCPGCQAVWQFVEEKWRKVVGVSSLQSLRSLSAKD